MQKLTAGKSDPSDSLKDLTPQKIVSELERFIVGQDDAKRAVAVAIRNRWRRKQLTEEMRQEVAPKNILMIGPTGVGKTEIARRLAKLTGAPFIKVEATKYTEVGYYGRDVESMIRELVENAIGLVRERERANVQDEAKHRVEERLLEMLLPRPVAMESAEEEDAQRHEQINTMHIGMIPASLAAPEPGLVVTGRTTNDQVYIIIKEDSDVV